MARPANFLRADIKTIKPGNIVRLRGTYGPDMTVNGVDKTHDVAHCLWFSKDGELHDAMIRPSALLIMEE